MAWELDPFHSLVEFSVKHLMINTVKGRFPNVHGSIHLDPQRPQNSWVKALVNTASIDTCVPQRDAHLRSADFFDVSKYPTITFESTQVRLVGPNRCVLNGNLTLHGVTQSVTFQSEFTGHGRDPFTDASVVGLFATAIIDRRDFGMGYDQMAGGVSVVGYKVRIDINMEARLVG